MVDVPSHKIQPLSIELGEISGVVSKIDKLERMEQELRSNEIYLREMEEERFLSYLSYNYHIIWI